MKIQSMFYDDIDRKINGVVKVDQDTDEVLKQEVKEYVITKDIRKHMITFFNNYGEAFQEPTADVGVWISGFFGSGKSHFLKMLSYLVENRAVDGKTVEDYFREKFGRYSLNEPGLAYAGGEWNSEKYQTYPADKDNIIPICDDEYFADDIVGRFVKFIETVYGKKSLDSNIRFIADALGGKGQPIDVIRNYFMNDFYADHCKIYQKRPIYWLFDSGKKGGFKALIYMHRYQPDTIARIRTDYVHEQQSRYRTAISDLEARTASAATSEQIKLNKQLKKLQDQSDEIHVYEEKIHHLADQMISIDLDDGVKVNYARFQDVLAKIK